MRKFLTVVKREYLQRVRAKMFIVSTILLPLVMSLFGIVPAIILNIKTPPVRVAVVDQTGKMFAQLKQALFNVETDQGTTTPAQNINRKIPSCCTNPRTPRTTGSSANIHATASGQT